MITKEDLDKLICRYMEDFLKDNINKSSKSLYKQKMLFNVFVYRISYGYIAIAFSGSKIAHTSFYFNRMKRNEEALVDQINNKAYKVLNHITKQLAPDAIKLKPWKWDKKRGKYIS